jgi:hypothetical protein
MRYLVAVVALILSVSFARANTLKQGERTGYRGVFCKTVEAATPIAAALGRGDEAVATSLYNKERLCVLASIPIEVKSLVSSHGKFAVVKVEDPNGHPHYIITNLKYEVAGLAI